LSAFTILEALRRFSGGHPKLRWTSSKPTNGREEGRGVQRGSFNLYRNCTTLGGKGLHFSGKKTGGGWRVSVLDQVLRDIVTTKGERGREKSKVCQKLN